MSAPSSDNAKFLEQIENWRTKLLDLTKRNPLISMKTEGRGMAILITHPQPDHMWKRLFESSEASMTFYCENDILSEKKVDSASSDKENSNTEKIVYVGIYGTRMESDHPSGSSTSGGHFDAIF